MKAIHKEYKWIGIALLVAILLLTVVVYGPIWMQEPGFWKGTASLAILGTLYLIIMLYMNSRSVIEKGA